MNTCDKDMVLVACPPKINYNNYNVVCMYYKCNLKVMENFFMLHASQLLWFIWLYCIQKINFYPHGLMRV